MVRGLKAIHDLRVMHRDLKSANVFLNQDLSVKLGDMNVSKVANHMGLNYTQTGTPYYASPEIWQDKAYDIKSDIWSMGCVLYEMITLRPPFQAEDMQSLFKKVLRGKYRQIPSVYSSDLALMIQALLQVDPTHRPDCGAIMGFPAFARHSLEILPELAKNEDI